MVSTASSAIGFLIFLIFAGIISVLIPALIGVYVYKDAKSREMDAVLWTIVAILVPGFIGLIIYLVIRGSSVQISCPGCKKPVTGEFALCPFCGARLKVSCPSCAAPAEKHWKLCPMCGTGLPEQGDAAYIYTEPKKDRRLLSILILAIVLPIFILAVAVGSMIAFRKTTSSSEMGGGVPKGFEDGVLFSGVTEWTAQCDASGEGVFVLKLSEQKARELNEFVSPYSEQFPEKAEIFCVIVYINQSNLGKGYLAEGPNIECAGDTMVLTYSTLEKQDEENEGCELSYAYNATDNNREESIKKVRIIIDDKKTEYTLSELN